MLLLTLLPSSTEAYLECCQTYNSERFCEYSSVLDFSQGSENASFQVICEAVV